MLKIIGIKRIFVAWLCPYNFWLPSPYCGLKQSCQIFGPPSFLKNLFYQDAKYKIKKGNQFIIKFYLHKWHLMEFLKTCIAFFSLIFTLELT